MSTKVIAVRNLEVIEARIIATKTVLAEGHVGQVQEMLHGLADAVREVSVLLVSDELDQPTSSREGALLHLIDLFYEYDQAHPEDHTKYITKRRK